MPSILPTSHGACERSARIHGAAECLSTSVRRIGGVRTTFTSRLAGWRGLPSKSVLALAIICTFLASFNGVPSHGCCPRSQSC
ncbi:hypothetical protein GY45DRAFT_648499 [Cubamyces sp. BRFM 1775]|nr:hypothetical protein GY45DRAFT_648499 [Cubamyces sp. BRFM 1775]